MVFSSLSFIFLILPLFLILDFLSRIFGSIKLRNYGLLFISLLFYTWGESAGVFLLFFLGIINFYASQYLLKNKNPHLYIFIIILFNLAILIGFKYLYWLLSFFFPILEGKRVSIPLGISFFVFHAISYQIDIYRQQILPAKTALDFLTYFCMFPHLVAGPIVRYSQVKNELLLRGPDNELFSFGIYRFLVGLNKKILIANSVAIIADSAFFLSEDGNLKFLDAWLGIVAYAIQIYFDFSGYSDMAIGLAAMAGFHFEENFQRPYSSKSIREFWRRWHISLSSWLRDYLYIPLGGSKKGNLSTYRNLLIVFFLCGLWHGANVTFIFRGLWHCLFLIAERVVLGRFLEKIPSLFARIYTLLIILIGWVFFRAESVSSASTYLKQMITFSSSPMILTYYVTACAVLLIACILCLLPDNLFSNPTSKNSSIFSLKSYILQVILAVFSISLLITETRNPFIYFNF